MYLIKSAVLHLLSWPNHLTIQDKTALNFLFLKPVFLAFSWWNLWDVLGNPTRHLHYWCQLCLFINLSAPLCMCHLPLAQLAVLPTPSMPSLSLCHCSARGRDHGHASHHGMGQRRSGGFGPPREPLALLQDPDKHPAGDACSWLHVCHRLAPLSRCTRSCIGASSWSSDGALKYNQVLVLQM